MLFRPANFGPNSRSPVMVRDSNIVDRENLPSETIPLDRLSESVPYIFTHKKVRHAHRHHILARTVCTAVQTENQSPFCHCVATNTDAVESHKPNHPSSSPSLNIDLAEKAKKLQERQAILETFLAEVRDRNIREGHVQGKVKRMVAMTNARQNTAPAVSPRLNESAISFRPLMTPSPHQRRD